MLKIENHVCHNSCLSTMLITLWIKKACFKSKNNPSCIDLFITNSSNSFQNTSTMTTGLSDLHKMVVTVLKKTFLKSKLTVITYRDYRSFDNDKFKSDLKNSLKLRNVSWLLRNPSSFFTETCPIIQRVIRANHARTICD